MGRKLRSPFVIVLAGAMACSTEAPTPREPEVVLPLNPPLEVPKQPIEQRPAPDRDGDGIADADDKCPDEVGNDETPEFFGCKARVRIRTSNPPAPIQQLMFDGTATEPNASSSVVLDEVAKIMRARPDFKLLRIEAHEDPSTKPAKALAISNARAAAVVRELVKRGVDKARLRALGLGGYCPLEDRGTPDARVKNRRAEMKIEVTDQGASLVEVGCGPSRDAGIQ